MELKALAEKGNFIQAYHNTESAVYKILDENPYLWQNINKSNNKSIKDHFLLFGNDSIFYEIDLWGLYLRFKIYAKVHGQRFERTFLVGRKKGDYCDKVLILANTETPLILSGKTRITGDVLTGSMGIRRGVMKGEPYLGDKLVDGNILLDAKVSLPNITYIQNSFFNLSLPIVTELKHGKALFLEGKKIDFSKQKFLRLQQSGLKYIIGPGRLESNGNLWFENVELLNQVECIADSNVTFGGNVRTEYVLVKSRDIVIRNGHKHRGQYLATRSINIKNSNFKYPSSLALVLSKKYSSSENNLYIGENTVVNGSVVLYDANETSNTYSRIIIDKSSLINGMVYSHRYMEFHGKVTGTVMTDGFFFYSSPTTYINWLDGAIIERLTQATDDFFIPAGFNNGEPLHIIGNM